MKRIGFTLIELLVVIAIIAILAAIIFPAAMRAKDAAYRSSDMSHMNELRTALQLYRVDQGAYPPLLFGYVSLYASGPNVGKPIPADQTMDYLYPKRVTSLATFQPAFDRALNTDIVNDPNNTDPTTWVYWPGISGNPTDCTQQAYGWQAGNANNWYVSADPNDNTTLREPFYKVDGLDVAQVKNPNGTTRYELHYALFWTGYGLGSKGNGGSQNCTLGSASDNPRQLGYNNPPDSTVITWNSFFREYDANNLPLHEKREIVLFLGGNARLFDSYNVAQLGWNISP